MPLFRPTAGNALLIRSLDAMTLIYHRPSGITHMVVEPIPQILEVMDGQDMAAETVAEKLLQRFDLGEAQDALPIITDRLEEMASLGLVQKLSGEKQVKRDA